MKIKGKAKESMVPVKPKAVQAFEGRFRQKTWFLGDVFILHVANNWDNFFRTAFCFLNDSSLSYGNLENVRDFRISAKGVLFSGLLLRRNVWRSDCYLTQGSLKVPGLFPKDLEMNLGNGVFLLASEGSDSIY